MEEVNRKRGSVAPAVLGQTLEDITELWRKDVAPNLARSTLRQRESHLRQHILSRFGKEAPHSLTISVLQQFATVLRQKVSRKTVVQVLVTISGIQKYALRRGVRAVVVSLKHLEMVRHRGVRTSPRNRRSASSGWRRSLTGPCLRWRGGQDYVQGNCWR